MLKEIIRKLREVFEKDSNILFAVLFGSFARGHNTSSSDIDIAVRFKVKPDFDYLNDLIYSIAKTLNYREDKIDILVLDDSVPYELRYRVFRDGIPIIIRDSKAFKHYRDKSISLFLDFKVFKKKLRLDEKYLESLQREING